jgi:hypothetical protein
MSAAMGFNIPDTLDGALVFAIAGFILAFVSISLIALVVAALPLLNRFAPSSAKAGRVRPPAPAQSKAEIVSEYEVAAISAAVAAMVGAHRIVHIEPAPGLGWQAEGRAAHHGSHAVTHSGAAARQPDNHTGNSHGA